MVRVNLPLGTVNRQQGEPSLARGSWLFLVLRKCTDGPDPWILSVEVVFTKRARAVMNPPGFGADVVSGTSCSLLPAGPWGVVRWGVRRVCGFAAGVARGGAGVGARSERAAALLRGRFGSCSPVSVSSVRCLCCRDVLWASGYLACLVWSRLTNALVRVLHFGALWCGCRRRPLTIEHPP